MDDRNTDEKQHDNVLDRKRDASKSLTSEKVGYDLKLEMSDIAIGVAESSDVAVLSSRKSSCFKDADDLLNDIDDITYGTSTFITKRKSSDTVVKKKKTQVKVSKVKLDDDYHIGFATTDEVTDAHNEASPRVFSDIPLRLPPIISNFPKVGAQKPEVADAKLDKKADHLTQPIISNFPKVDAQKQEVDDAMLDKKTEDVTRPIISNFPKAGTQKQEVNDAKLDKKAEDLTHVLQHIKYQVDDIDTFAQKKQSNDYTARKLGSVVISVPSAAMVTPGNRDGLDALPGEVMEFSEKYKTRNVITNTTEIDNGVVKVIQEVDPQKKPNIFKELFCSCFRSGSKEQKEELKASRKQSKQHSDKGVIMHKSKTDVEPVKKQAKKEEANKSKDTTDKSKAKKKSSKVGCSKVHVIGSEVKIDNGFLHFEPFGERRDNCFRRLWRRITGRG